jgi:hypothetical protein
MKEPKEEDDIHQVQPMIKQDPSAIFSNRKFRAVTYNACGFGDTGPFAEVFAIDMTTVRIQFDCDGFLVSIRPLSVT